MVDAGRGERRRMTQQNTSSADRPALEFRPREDGSFDEIVARFSDGIVHVETMSKKGCYVGFYWDDGRYCQWWISSEKRLSYHHENGFHTPQLQEPRE